MRRPVCRIDFSKLLFTFKFVFSNRRLYLRSRHCRMTTSWRKLRSPWKPMAVTYPAVTCTGLMLGRVRLREFHFLVFVSNNLPNFTFRRTATTTFCRSSWRFRWMWLPWRTSLLVWWWFPLWKSFTLSTWKPPRSLERMVSRQLARQLGPKPWPLAQKKSLNIFQILSVHSNMHTAPSHLSTWFFPRTSVPVVMVAVPESDVWIHALNKRQVSHKNSLAERCRVVPPPGRCDMCFCLMMMFWTWTYLNH